MSKGNCKRTIITINVEGNILIVNKKCMNVTFFSMGNYIRIIMITFGGNICLIKKKIRKITYFVQRKLHKNIIIRLYNAMKIDNVILIE